MTDYILDAKSALGGLSGGDANFRFAEITGGYCYSVACHENRVASLASRLLSCGIALPETRRLTRYKNLSLFSSGRAQWFLLSPQEDPEILSKITIAMPGQLAITDQSDAWVQIRLSGRGVQNCLTRLCALNLHPQNFPIGSVARTMMKHLNVIILHEKSDVIDILSARSSARSLVYMLTERARSLI